ncbi:MAG: hypothetical protein COA86_08140 [Kangiella sp.]|nr:MAG: hypothetical protein COA86_08140 [Kangiella sp.]
MKIFGLFVFLFTFNVGQHAIAEDKTNANSEQIDIEATSNVESDLEQEGIWELGFGVGGLSIAHYIGAEDTRNIAIPIPYLKYQGKFLKADRRGVRGVFWSNKAIEINMSFDLLLPVKSADNLARAGMPDLDFGLELGPATVFILYEDKLTSSRVSFNWPVRAAFAFTSDGPEQYGWITSPKIQYQKYFSNWKWTSSFSIEYANKEYQSYFYTVEREFVTSTRREYDAISGFHDFSLQTSFSRRIDQWYFGAFIQYVDLNHAANKNSPLVKSLTNVNLGSFLIWVF